MAIEQKNPGGLLVVLAIVAVLGVIVVSSMQAIRPITVNTGPQSPDRNILTVTGTHEMEVTPDMAELTLEVVTRYPTAARASEVNRETLQAVVAALKAEGVADDEIETVNVYLQKVQEWDYENQRTVDRGYEQRTTLRVTTSDLTNVGAILDAAVGAGANSVQDIAFTLTPEKQTQVKEQALAAAAQTAKGKAETLARASGATLGRITALSENSYNYQPWYANSRAVMALDVAGAEKAPTPISPENVQVTVSVTIGYELQ
jgi:uncharacterized protein YggE